MKNKDKSLMPETDQGIKLKEALITNEALSQNNVLNQSEASIKKDEIKLNDDSNNIKKDEKTDKKQIYTSLLLVLLAIVCVTVTTIAWFTIADNTKVNSISMDITTGSNLRFDLDPHEEFTDYLKTLTFNDISNRILKEKGFDMSEVPLEPVTTEDVSTFTFEDGTVFEGESGAYLEFTLNFMATQNMFVHLTTANSSGNSDGKLISSDNSNLVESMRISFTANNFTYVYDPGMGDESTSGNGIKTFGLKDSSSMVLNDNNKMFYLMEFVNKPVVVHIWLEGTDEACIDDLRGAEYKISLRFVGTDKNNNSLEAED
jgi:hypothetical protein